MFTFCDKTVCLLFDILLLVSKSFSSHFVVVRYCGHNKNKHTEEEKEEEEEEEEEHENIALPFVNNNCGDASFLGRSLKRIKQLRMGMSKQYLLLRSERG